MRKCLLGLLIVSIAISCRHDGLTSGRLPNIAPELIQYPGATNVRSGRAQGFQRLTYTVTVPYPAAPVIQSIAAQLAKGGWRPARNKWLDTSYQSEYLRGWTQSTVVSKPGGKQRFMCQWSAQWSNDHEDILSYTFYYLSPGEQPTNMSKLDVQGELMSRAVADAFRKQFPPENTARPLRLLPVGTAPNAATATDNSPDPKVFRMRRDSD